MAELEKLSPDQVQNIVQVAIEEATDYIESEVEDERIKSARYFNGEVDIGHEHGRSKVVATKCRDVVRAVKPSLMRIFLASGKPVEFVPTSPDDVQAAEQATAYAQWKFNQKDGYKILHNAFHDALVKKAGFVQVYYDETEEAEIDEYTGLDENQFALVANDPSAEILEYEETPEGFNAKVSFVKPKGDICMEGIAPEDFFVDSRATGVDDFYVIGHSNGDMRVGDVVAMGYEFDEVIPYAGQSDDAYKEEADFERSGYTDTGETDSVEDPSMRLVLTTNAYMRIDIDSTGIPTLYKFLCLGTNFHILDSEPADYVPYAVFEIDPEPHTFFGRSLVEIVEEDQDAATAMLRGLLDNVALSNSPGAQVLTGKVDMKSMLNNEIGRIVPVKEMGAIQYDAVPFIAGQTLGAMQYYDDVVDNKTGVTRAAAGLDADALQGATATAINATVAGAQAQPELMARNLAEGGMSQLVRLIVMLSRQHVDREVMMQVDNGFVPVDPRSWSADMDMVANVGIGTNGEIEREQVLRETLNWQMTIYAQGGAANGLVTKTHIRNTLADILKMGGISNSDRHFFPITEPLEKLLDDIMKQFAAQAQQGAPDPGQAIVAAETIKAQQKSQTDMAKLELDKNKAINEYRLKLLEMHGKNDLERDKMVQELLVDAAKIFGEYGAQVDVAGIQQAQAAPRQ